MSCSAGEQLTGICGKRRFDEDGSDLEGGVLLFLSGSEALTSPEESTEHLPVGFAVKSVEGGRRFNTFGDEPVLSPSGTQSFVCELATRHGRR